jgi:hypothetical protein
MHRQAMILWVIVVAGCVGLAQNSWSHAGPSPAAWSDAALQDSSSAPTQASGHQAIAIELSKSLDTKKLKQGDLVKAKITSVFEIGNGKVVPIGSTVQGHVTQAVTRSKGEAQSSLGIAFDSIVLKDGQQLPLKATIQAVGAPPDWVINNPAGGNNRIGGPPMGSPGSPGSYPGGTGPIGGTNPTGGYPPAPSSQPQGRSGQPDTTNSPGLTAQSTGVVGMRDVSLEANSVLTSSGKDLKLEAGTEMILRVQDQ